MTILASLNRCYHRLLDQGLADPPGSSREPVSYCIWLDAAGGIEEVEDLRDHSGRKPVIRRLRVPQAVIRTSGIVSNFLWDKTSYVLGVSMRASKRAAAEHAAFKALHLNWLERYGDEALMPLQLFLRQWRPETFHTHSLFTPDMLDKNFVFGLSGMQRRFLHDEPAVQAFMSTRAEAQWKIGRCLITGEIAPIARLHPPIKGVDGAQSSGARLVSFGADAFTSYGSNNGANAPISEVAAYRYGTALNHLLDRTSHHQKKIGDSTLVYWAEPDDEDDAAAIRAERDFGALVGQESTDDKKIEGLFLSVRFASASPVRFHVLGLNPNAGRLSVRYWLTSDTGRLGAALRRHMDDITLEPAPWGSGHPSIRYLLVRTTALMEKIENIPAGLTSEVTRAVFEGTPYPRALLSTAISRLRAGDSPHTGWHAAVLKACINRLEKEKLPVARTPDHPATAYQLGRLFAILDAAQYAALGRVSASITDRYFKTASAAPARIFGALLGNVHHHIHDANRRGKGLWIEARLNEIMDRLPPDIPSSLSLADQGRFAVGYYHERRWRGPGQTNDEIAKPAAAEEYSQA